MDFVILDGGKAGALYAFPDAGRSRLPDRVRGAGRRHQAGRMLTERLAASPHARDPAARAARSALPASQRPGGKIWPPPRNQTSVA